MKKFSLNKPNNRTTRTNNSQSSKPDSKKSTTAASDRENFKSQVLEKLKGSAAPTNSNNTKKGKG